MPGTESKTMKPENVVYPSQSSRHAVVGVYSGMKSSFPILLGHKVDGNLDHLNFSKADTIIANAMRNKATVKSTYFKIGVIGTDLVLRVKTQQGGVSGFFKGHDHKDAVLLQHVTIKKGGGGGAKSEMIAFATYIVLAPGDLPALASRYYNIGKGFGMKLSVKIDGADKNSGIRARVADLKEEFCQEYHVKAMKIVNDLEATLKDLDIANESSLTTAAEAAQAEIQAMLAPAKIAKEFEDRVKAMVASDANLRQHAREWKIKGACNAILTTVKMATAVARLVATHGADVSSYKSIVSAAFTFYSLIKDFTKEEQQVAKELDQAIELYKKSANDLVDEVQAAYAQCSLGATSNLTKLQAMATAGSQGAQIAMNKVTVATRKLTGKSVAEGPETARKRYLVELGKLVQGLEEQFNKLAEATDQFQRSDIQRAVAVWPKLQALKKQANAVLVAFKAKLVYATNAKAEIESLGIETSDATTLDKLRKGLQGLRELDKSKVIDGASPTASLASSIYGAYKAVNALVSAVEAAAA